MNRLLALALALGCGGGDPDEPANDPDPVHVPEVDGDPLVPSVPLYPWPSDLWLAEDTTSLTSQHLALPADLVPEGVLVDVFAPHDGFTRIPALVTTFTTGVDPAGLPSIPESVGDDSTVWLLAPDGSRVPLVVELDGNVTDPLRQALLIRPQVTLDEQTTYVAVIRHTLTAPDGSALPESPAFAALRDGTPTDNEVVEGMRDRFAPVLAALDATGVDPAEVALAWPFTTRSEAQVVSPALDMHDIALAQGITDWAITAESHDGANHVVEGTFTSPDFLGPDGRITLGPDGLPEVHGDRTVAFVLAVPDTVGAPRPLVLFGHGFFSAKEEILWGSLQQSLQPWAMSSAAVDFIGFNEADLPETVVALGGDLDALARTVDQQLQSHVHFTLLAELVRGPLADAVVVDRDGVDVHPIDPAAVHYMGISNGGTQGATILATSPAITRGALVVPGGAWSHMLQRAVQWRTLGAVIDNKYTDPLELQLVLALTQQVLDPVDCLNYARGLVTDPYDGRSANQVTLHMAVEDSQVANLVTEWVARSADIPLVVPSTVEPFGLEQVDAAPPGRNDLPAALLVYDEGYPEQPAGNVPPYEENGAHETIRDLLVYQESVGAFLETGTILQTCDGACDPD